MFCCAVFSLATAIVAAFLGFAQVASAAGVPLSQHVFLLAIVTFTLSSLRVVLDPGLLR